MINSGLSLWRLRWERKSKLTWFKLNNILQMIYITNLTEPKPRSGPKVVLLPEPVRTMTVSRFQPDFLLQYSLRTGYAALQSRAFIPVRYIHVLLCSRPPAEPPNFRFSPKMIIAQLFQLFQMLSIDWIKFRSILSHFAGVVMLRRIYPSFYSLWFGHQ